MIHLPAKKVAVIPIADPDKIGHIIVPDQAKERTDQGVVKYAGSRCEWVRPGMYVTFSGWSGQAFRIADPDTKQEERLIILDEDYIVCEILDDPLEVEGLYFRARSGEYFPATFEMAMELIADSWRNQPWSPLHIRSEKLKRDEYKAAI